MYLNNQEATRTVEEYVLTTAVSTVIGQVERYFDGLTSDIPTRYGVLEASPALLWPDEEDRTKARYFHAFLFMAGWGRTIIESTTCDGIRKATALVRNWDRLFPIENIVPGSMSYHDETTAQRLNTVLSLIVAAENVSDLDSLEYLRAFADKTSALLAREEFHGGRNNHGMFQDISLRNYSVLAEWADPALRESYLNISCERLESYFHSAFTIEGVHVENSPTYHLMVARSLNQHVKLLTDLDHPSASALRDLLSKAGKYAAHIIMPNGHFPPISDSTKGRISASSGAFLGDNFVFSASIGKDGIKPIDCSVVFPESGYSIYRSDWESKSATYVLLQAAYNNNYHKHSDDLSVIIYGKGREIITEPGPYSYNYKDPFSRYAYSQFAHNNVVVDNKSILRTDDKRDTVKIDSFDIDEDSFSVSASTGRLKDVIHRRAVGITGDKRNETITVRDALSSAGTHEYSQYWNIGVGLDVVTHGSGFEVFDGQEKLLDAFIKSKAPFRVTAVSGSTRPVLGWSFPKFGDKRPTNVVRVEFSGSNEEIETTFNLSNYSYADRGLTPAAGNNWKSAIFSRNVNYLEVDSSNSDKNTPLVFVFTAMGLIGNFSYNYKATLDKISSHVFYILDDFGDQGAYYLQEKGDRSIFESVAQLIHQKIKQFGAGREIYFVGSSKGGTAALLHGLTVPEANIFVGAPQTKIGSFLKNPHPNILEYMTGGVTAEHISSLDDVLYSESMLRQSTAKISIVVGKADHHYKNHVIPWAHFAESVGKSVKLIVKEGTPHSEIGKVYRQLLQNELMPVVSTDAPPVHSEAFALSTNTWYDNTSSRLFASCRLSENERVAFRLYKGNQLEISASYQRENFISWENLPSGRYRVRFFLKNIDNEEVRKVTGAWVILSE